MESPYEYIPLENFGLSINSTTYAIGSQTRIKCPNGTEIPTQNNVYCEFNYDYTTGIIICIKITFT